MLPFLILMLATTSQAEDTKAWLVMHPDEIAAYRLKCQEYSQKLEPQLKRDAKIAAASIVQIRKTRVKPPVDDVERVAGTEGAGGVVRSFGSKANKDAAIKKAQERIDEIERHLDEIKAKKKPVLAPLESLAAGSMGLIADDLSVSQVADESHCRASVWRIVGEFWAELPTGKYSDGRTYKFDKPKFAVVVGNHKYATASGSSRTIPHVLIVDMDEVENLVIKKVEK